ncbi:hypothetical protein GCM10028812_38000 [Ancylobacter sonchi]
MDLPLLRGDRLGAAGRDLGRGEVARANGGGEGAGGKHRGHDLSGLSVSVVGGGEAPDIVGQKRIACDTPHANIMDPHI